ncbi:putative 39S ribosomal protein L45, mitochondrial [Nymphon striatum]|nr:putative 39S ribosomal protein L45, mitochondrial [Nymphon striatum]
MKGSEKAFVMYVNNYKIKAIKAEDAGINLVLSFSSLLMQSTSPVTFAGVQSVRNINVKYFDRKFREHRRKKVLKVDLPDFELQRRRDKMTPDEIRSEMKAKGIVPPFKWSERTMFVSCTAGVFEQYVPPEGDGKKSIVSMEGAKQIASQVEKRGKSMLGIRKIRKFDEAFDVHDFSLAAQNIYVEVNEKLTNIKENEYRLHDLVTEYCYPLMVENMRLKTIRWSFIKSLEPPRVVHARSTSTTSDENIFAQITVRFHSQQTLAMYDRFGRLMHGSEVVAKDVLEYVVFEKHLANNYGAWRIHSKIIPDWMPPKEPSKITFVKPQLPPELQSEETESEKKIITKEEVAASNESKSQLVT